MNPFDNIRWIYNQEQGRTIAYSRCKAGIRFSVARCNEEDPYTKSIGKQLTEKRLLENFTNNDNYEGVVTHFDNVKMVGFITTEVVINFLSPTFCMLSEKFVEKITLNDFKHKALISVVDSYVDFKYGKSISLRIKKMQSHLNRLQTDI